MNDGPYEDQNEDNSDVHKERCDPNSESVKRSHDEAFPTDSELSLMSKPERKRYREKRRRDRVNASFDELRALLIRVDPQCSNRADISQLELIDRSIIVINTLLEERSRNRELIRELEARQRERVLVSIPFVNPFENETSQSIETKQHASEGLLNYSNVSLHQRFSHHTHHHFQTTELNPATQQASGNSSRYSFQDNIKMNPSYFDNKH